MKRLTIKLTYKCNNNCLFCAEEENKSKKDISIDKVEKIIKDNSKEFSSIVFSGGEPLLVEKLFYFSYLAKSLGYTDIQLQSNGRLLSKKRLCKLAILSGINNFAFSLHGDCKEVHEYHTQSINSFNDVIDAVSNLSQLNIPVMLNTVVTKKNYKNLKEIINLVSPYKIEKLQLAFPHITGKAEDYLEAIVPRMTEVIPFVEEAIDHAIALGISLETEAIPPCMLQGEFRTAIAEKSRPYYHITRNEKVFDFDKWIKVEGKAKHKNCKRCTLYDECEGPWEDYPRYFGWEEFIPV
jgi:MoaA/NifB/PqqE/SkfB family radical SAM enzyme